MCKCIAEQTIHQCKMYFCELQLLDIVFKHSLFIK
ncbi:hypothetical protein ACJIZ3_024595 [Penstemon smallii]|uniref:Uncharacterized protein n=1 Tax=Penstemon smallii TaxID=265156 RepID=A0ABD3TSD0_9LAMI